VSFCVVVILDFTQWFEIMWWKDSSVSLPYNEVSSDVVYIRNRILLETFDSNSFQDWDLRFWDLYAWRIMRDLLCRTWPMKVHLFCWRNEIQKRIGIQISEFFESTLSSGSISSPHPTSSCTRSKSYSPWKWVTQSYALCRQYHRLRKRFSVILIGLVLWFWQLKYNVVSTTDV
jgi:hypothetical protein